MKHDSICRKCGVVGENPKGTWQIERGIYSHVFKKMTE